VSGHDESRTPGPDIDGSSPGRRLAVDVVLYSVMRIALVVVIAAIIYGVGRAVGVEIPIIIAALFALVIALPLGFVLFRGQRAKVNEGIGVVDDQRRTRRDELRSRLRGTNDNYYEAADDKPDPDSGGRDSAGGDSASGGAAGSTR
jgi:hypothetical protein